jgi:hypothetical protein
MKMTDECSASNLHHNNQVSVGVSTLQGHASMMAMRVH